MRKKSHRIENNPYLGSIGWLEYERKKNIDYKHKKGGSKNELNHSFCIFACYE